MAGVVLGSVADIDQGDRGVLGESLLEVVWCDWSWHSIEEGSRSLVGLEFTEMTMRYSEEELRDRLHGGEDSGWEFKELEFRGKKPAGSQRAQWADEIVAFANGSGGVMLLGVSDLGEVAGLSRDQMDAVERMVVEICRDTVSPAVRASVYKVKLDGQWLVLVEVPEGDGLYERDGRSYVRVGSAKQLMSSDERMRLALRRGQAQRRSFDETTVRDTGFGAFSERLWKPLLSAENLSNPHVGLEKLGLLAANDHDVLCATVAGVLFCTEAPEEHLPQAAIMAVRYRGLDEASGQIDAQVIGGPVDLQIRHALAFAVRNMRVAARKDPAREDLPEYSVRAIFEALVNAIAHRDYTIRGGRIRLRIFSDRLEIRSPGALPNSLTIESMSERQATRNEVVTSLLSRISAGDIEAAGGRRYFMERRGDGMPIIKSETIALTGRMPEYRLIDDSELCVTLPAAELQSGPASVVITVRTEGTPFAGATVLALFPNNTWKSASTNELGEAQLDLHTVNLPMTVFFAGPRFAGHVEREWLPSERSLAIELTPLVDGGSVVIAESTGHIPGLRGRLNPILDTLQRSYLYASNITIDGGEQQPVTFAPGVDELHLMDADGTGRLVRIIAISGRSSLLEYRDVGSV